MSCCVLMTNGYHCIKSFVLIAYFLIASTSGTTHCTPNDYGSCSDSDSLLQSKLTYSFASDEKMWSEDIDTSKKRRHREQHTIMSNFRVSEKAQLPPWGHSIEVPVGITHVSINVGPSFTPITVDDEHNLLILVDPLTSVVSHLLQHDACPHVLVYQAAISNVTGTAVFHEYNAGGQSSSLSTPSNNASWNNGTSAITVPVHTLKELIDAIPSNMPISLLKTDMQGYDFVAIKSAGDGLKRIKRIMSETYTDGKPTYAHTMNEYHRDWLPYMTKIGFALDEEECVDSYVDLPLFHEMDCHWKKSAAQIEDPSEWKTIKVYTGTESILGTKGHLHSQAAQDWLVASLLGCKSGGFFVDLAANNAIELSNTLMLERDFAWKGLCVEANMEYMYGLSHRKCQIISAVVGASRDQTVNFTMNGVFGGIVGTDTDNHDAGGGTIVNLKTIPLGDIFEEMQAPTDIDYFSLDVEGAESIVMNGFPWEKYRFSVITVERPKPDLKLLLTEHGYQRLRVNSNFQDETWISTKIPNLTELMQSWGNKKVEEYPESCMIERGYAIPSYLFGEAP